ncbi:MAG: lysophospholipid acyltransferase family protein [Parvibaculaceae bacterium]
MSRLRAIVILAAFVLLTLLLMPVQVLLLTLSSPAAGRFGAAYWRLVRRLIGTRILVTGERPRGGALIAANHTSWLDIVVLGGLAPASFVAKREVRQWPLFGTVARLGRTIFVDRDSRRSVRLPFAEMQARLEAGETIILFPEGTSSDGNRVLPFRSALMGAAETLVDGRPVSVQPVTVAYRMLWGLPLDRRRRPQFSWYGDMLLWPHLLQALATGPVDASVTFHPPLTISEAGGRKELARRCEEAIRSGLRTG